ncbi:large conductance mechanosensitive channel protein MscL [Longispora albida]|uniref:large conductance mechanosensitive channel protein MscL n=1 Tax=Longispora albida TaxID=203523 RepID=UPI0004771019|nr:large conductance mechanosensitive channel protein MscL [Longispora albida]
MLKGFKNFIMRGNVVDLAVAVVIGAAFTALVGQFTKSFLDPMIKVITGGNEIGGKFTINDVDFDYGAFIGAIITFLLTAAVLYFLVVLPLNKYNEYRRRNEEAAAEKLSHEVELLTEIRDLLRRG